MVLCWQLRFSVEMLRKIYDRVHMPYREITRIDRYIDLSYDTYRSLHATRAKRHQLLCRCSITSAGAESIFYNFFIFSLSVFQLPIAVAVTYGLVSSQLSPDYKLHCWDKTHELASRRLSRPRLTFSWSVTRQSVKCHWDARQRRHIDYDISINM